MKHMGLILSCDAMDLFHYTRNLPPKSSYKMRFSLLLYPYVPSSACTVFGTWSERGIRHQLLDKCRAPLPSLCVNKFSVPGWGPRRTGHLMGGVGGRVVSEFCDVRL